MFFYEEIKSIIVKTQCVLLYLKRRIKLLVAKQQGIERKRMWGKPCGIGSWLVKGKGEQTWEWARANHGTHRVRCSGNWINAVKWSFWPFSFLLSNSFFKVPLCKWWRKHFDSNLDDRLSNTYPLWFFLG